MRCRECRDLFAESLFASDPQRVAAKRQAVEDHLAECRSCAKELSGLISTDELLARHGHRRALPSRVAFVWSRLAPHLDEIDAAPGKRWTSLFAIPSLRLAAAAAAGLVAIVGLWLASSQPSQPSQSLPAPQAVVIPATVVEPEALLDEQLDRYLRRTKPLLLALANREPGAPVAFDSAFEQDLAARLAHEGAQLRHALGDVHQRREKALVGSLQVLFMQAANLPANDYPSGLPLLRASIEQKSLLFKLGLYELRRAAGQSATATT